MEGPSFSSRRPAAGSLPAFSLPPPNSEVPRASDGLSPSLSSVNTASSQSSQAHGNMGYTYSSAVHGGWPTQTSTSYNVGSTSPEQSYGSRSSMYGQHSLGFGGNPRSSQSPATGGDSLPHPSFSSFHQPFQASISGASHGGPDSHHLPSQTSQHGAMLNSTQAHPAATAPAPTDPYAHSRAHNNYYSASATTPQASFPSYSGTQQPSPTGTSPGSRGLPHHSSMAPPSSYRPYQSFAPPLGSMSGTVMSNIHQPGSHLSMMPGMAVTPGYSTHGMVFGHHAQPQQQSERPFKCDQCTQSFSRNHDLKRHKRIHLAVKPFPCNFCSKSFSRKDALKRHRLVKGCESKANAAAVNGDNARDRNGEADED